MSRLLTVPSGWGSAYAPTIGDLQTLAAVLSGTNAAINQAAESFSVEYPNPASILSYINQGGAYIDYCGWPMYYPAAISTYPTQGSPSYFGDFLASMGGDQYYCDGFDAGQAECMPNYPYERGWLSKYDISSTHGVIYGQGGTGCESLIFARGDRAYPMVAVRSTAGKGIYFYGAAGSSRAVDPNQYGQFILSVLPSSSGGTGTGGSLQQQCQSAGGVWYDSQCFTHAEYACIIAGGTWSNGQCIERGGSAPAPASSINWPLIIGSGVAGIGLIVGLGVILGGK